MVRIALDVNDLRNGVLRLIAKRIDDHPATYGTIRTRAAGFAGSRNLKILGLRVDRGEIEPQRRKACSANDGALEESPAGEFHETSSNHRMRSTALLILKKLGCETEV